MDEAEIIPIGTRGQPGRATGNLKPSSAARGLAPARRPASKRSMPSPRGVADHADEAIESAPEAEVALDVEAPEVEVSPAVEPVPAPRPASDANARRGDSAEAQGEPKPTSDARSGGDGKARDQSTGEDKTKARMGIPIEELLKALTDAAKEVYDEDADRKLAEVLAFLRRRLTGDYAVDDFGLDPELATTFLSAVVRPLAEKWFRIEVRGIENIPTEGGALVVSNHSGTLPLDALVTMAMVLEHSGRHLRALGADLIFRLPFVGELARKGGVTLACAEDAQRLLTEGHLVGVWPEGYKGLGKPYSDRYKLQRFGRGGFVATAIRSKAPIIPVAVVGAEEIYPLIGNIPTLARLLGVPYIPITPLFPWFGLFGLIPLPSKWIIEFGEPISTEHFEEAQADDPMVTFDVADQVRETIQQTLLKLLADRKSVFG